MTALELMPVAQFPGDRNWGYDGVHPYAVQNSYGGPQALPAVGRLRPSGRAGGDPRRGLQPSRPGGELSGRFGPTSRIATIPLGKAVNYDGPESDAVRQFVDRQRLRMGARFPCRWAASRRGPDDLRFRPRHILAEIQAAVQREAAAGRRVHVIAESNQNDVRLVRPRTRGGYGLDGVWSDDFHHSVHALLTGERDGYYLGFGEPRTSPRP